MAYKKNVEPAGAITSAMEKCELFTVARINCLPTVYIYPEDGAEDECYHKDQDNDGGYLDDRRSHITRRTYLLCLRYGTYQEQRTGGREKERERERARTEDRVSSSIFSCGGGQNRLLK